MSKLSNTNGLNSLIKIPEITVVIPIVIVILIGALFSDTFFNAKNILSIFRNVASIGIIAIFMTMLLMSKGLDLSPDAVAALTSVFFAFLLTNYGASLILSIPIVLGISLVIGLANALLILKLKIPSFIVTLGMLYIGKGLATIVAGGSYIMIKQEFAIYSFKILDITMDVFIFIGLAIVADLILRFTVFGRKIKLIGVNSSSAKISGIKTEQITAVLYILTSLSAGLASVLFTMRSGIGTTDCGSSWALQAITACIIGGTSLYGGKGSILGTILGVVFMGIITNLMMIFGIASEWQYVGIGLFMIVGILLGVYRERKLL